MTSVFVILYDCHFEYIYVKFHNLSIVEQNLTLNLHSTKLRQDMIACLTIIVKTYAKLSRLSDHRLLHQRKLHERWID